MLTAMVLICSLASTPDIADCSRTTATDVLWVPETFSNPVTCFMHGQAYVASTEMGRTLSDKERVKVVCMHQQASLPVDSTVARRTTSTTR